MAQLLLLPDPRPLDERLGRTFFREAPKCPGVYLMRDAADNVLYVGKAKNLQQRLRSYRSANPDRMARRHLRMVRQVVKIDFQFCEGESEALKHEAKLLRSLKPKFNRAGVWPGKTRFVTWRTTSEQLELAWMEIPEHGWRRFGPVKGVAIHLQQTLARLLWLAIDPARSFTDLPSGWAQGRIHERATLRCGEAVAEIAATVDAFFWDAPERFIGWLEGRFTGRVHPFECAVIEADLETLKEFSTRHRGIDKKQFALL